jgi:nucleoside-diphosphate-sugar epimerase
MRDVGAQKVAVVGAAGFVGRVLLRQLEERGTQVTAIVRGAPELSVDGEFHAVGAKAPGGAGDRFDVVVNLAYPTSGPGYEYPEQNLAIARTVEDLVKDGGAVIQVSTLAVFGMALDRPISAGPVTEVRDNAYVESKVAAERLLNEMQVKRGISLDIVRLGNVWGYASSNWATPLVHKLLTGRPVGVAGTAAHSNATDVANAASYLAFLLERREFEAGVRYHHLAEFSAVSWNRWIGPLAEALRVDPVYADPAALNAPTSARSELAEAVSQLMPRQLYRALAVERTSGSWTRTIVRRLPHAASARLKSSGAVAAKQPQYSRAEETFLAIMAGQREFLSVLRPGWQPPVSQDESLEQVLRWLARG